MKYLAILVGACLGVAAVSGCVVVDDGAGVGGTGGSVGGSGGSVGGSGGSVGGAGGSVGGAGGSVGGAGGTGGSAGCVTCSEFITPDLNPDGLPTCDGASTELYNALFDCTCTGACMADCGDNICDPNNGTATDACLTCIQQGGCMTEFSDCANDF